MPEQVAHVHTHLPTGGSVVLEVERNSRGYTWRAKVDRPVREGESLEQARVAALAELDLAHTEMAQRFGGASDEAVA